MNASIAENLSEQYNATQNAIGDAIDAGDCEVEKLLVIAGQKISPAIESLSLIHI